MSGLIPKLPRNDGASVMADLGFTIQNQLNELGVELNIPSFLDGHPARCKRVVLLHPCEFMWRERLAGLKIILYLSPLPLSRIANQIIMVCALLVNFQPVLIPLSTMEKADV